MAKKSIQPILQKQQQDSLNDIANSLKESVAIHADQLDTLKSIAIYANSDRLIQIAQVLEERKVQQDEDESLEIVKETNTNIIEMKEMISDQYLLQVEQLDVLTNIEKIGKSLLDSLTETKEDKSESERAAGIQTDLLEQIANNTTPIPAKETKNALEGGFGPLGILTGLAATIGSVVGVIKAWVNAVRLFTPDFLKELMMKPFKSLDKFIGEVVFDVKDVFSSVMKSVKGVIINEIEIIKNIFAEDSTMGKLFKSIEEIITKFTKPFEEAFAVIKSLLSGPLETLSNSVKAVFEGISKFSKAFSFISEIFSKLALPLMIIMTVWDTVKGAIEGYEKEGIVGAISGAIEGFMNSLILGPLDMIKDVVSWLAEKFGFENVSKILDSFSFEDTFKTLIETIKHPIDALSAVFDNLGKFFSEAIDDLMELIKGIGIPEIDLTSMLPEWVFDKIGLPKSIGPWMPFDENNTKSDIPKTESSTKAIPKSGVDYIIQPDKQTKSDIVYNKSNENAEAKENKSSGGNTVISAPIVNNSNKTVQNTSVKLPTRNPDTTSNRYVTSRYAVQ